MENSNICREFVDVIENTRLEGGFLSRGYGSEEEVGIEPVIIASIIGALGSLGSAGLNFLAKHREAKALEKLKQQETKAEEERLRMLREIERMKAEQQTKALMIGGLALGGAVLVISSLLLTRR